MNKAETITTKNWEDTLKTGLKETFLVNGDDTPDKAKFCFARSTRDYASFSYHPQNRTLIPRKIKVISNSMLRYGNCSIVLTRPSAIEIGKMEVYDGQHTLEACKFLKIPVNYAHFENVPLRVMIELNKNTTAWKLEDYLSFATGECLDDYISLDVYKKAVNLSISSLICLLSGSQSSTVFKGMAFKITRKDYADEVISYIKDFSDYITHWNHTKFIWAMCRVVDTGKYEHEHMMSKVRRASNKFRACSGVEGHKQAIEDMYNFGSRKIVRFA